MSRFNKLPRNKFFLAPIAGVSDPAFRSLCDKFGAGLTFSELTSIDFIYAERDLSLKEILRGSDERCVGLQLFGKAPEKIPGALEVVGDRFDFFDFNAGCPASNIVGQGAGSDLLGNTSLLRGMLEKLVGSTNKPVTLKYRLGINKSKENFLEVGKMAEDLGVSMVTLHARHAVQRYSGSAKWDRIKFLKEKLDIPVTGNGDVRCPEDARRMLDSTGCDYVMIGRWARGNPFCFSQLLDFFDKGSYEEVSASERLSAFLDYAESSKEFGVGFSRVKIQAMQFCKGFSGSVSLRKKIAVSKSREQIIKSMESFLRK